MPFNPNEPRDAIGRWTTGGAGADASHDDRVTDVGGDKWNQETAKRLEAEYAAQRAALDKLAQEAADQEVEVKGVVDSWDDVSGSIQDAAVDKYVEANFHSELDHEIENWHENGEAIYDAKHQLAEDDDWKHEELGNIIEARAEAEQPRIPYTPEDLAAAVKIEAGDESDDGPSITIDDSKLQHPDNDLSPDQMSLPGIEGAKPEDSLTKEMRADIVDHLTETFNVKAADKASDISPPDYLSEQANESLHTQWEEWSDNEKLSWTKDNTHLLDEGSEDSETSGTVAMPNTFDPLNETSGEDYRNTQKLAKYMSTTRAEQLMVERGITRLTHGTFTDTTRAVPGAPVESEDIAHADHSLWDGWKGSSSNSEGKLIQVAAHEELGGRLNTTSKGIDVEEMKTYANGAYKMIGGYAGIKALIRAKWETTQYLLDRADTPIVEAYRGIRLAGVHEAEGKFLDKALNEIPHEKVGTGIYEKTGAAYTKLPELHIARNGASSWTTDSGVANNWGGGEGHKVVLRAQVPRTSILSVPAYGVNVHSEHEVVVMGTAWKNWDAWSNRAPPFSDVALKPHVAKAPEPTKPKQTKAEKAHVVGPDTIEDSAA